MASTRPNDSSTDTTARATALATALELARADAAAGARAGRLTERVVAGLRHAGLFTMFLPDDLGGPGLALPDACELIARVAEADGAAGWAIMIGAGPNWFAGHMPAPLAAEVFGPADSCVAGSGTPGTGEDVDGGLRVSGAWRWCSGAPWATWFTFAVATAAGPEIVAVPAGEVSFDPDSWRVRGLAATASVDARLDGVVVPSARRFTIGAAPRRDEPIFHVPFLSFAEATMAAVAAGVGEQLLAAFAGLARHKTPAFASAPLAEAPVVRDRFARATASVRSARTHWTAAVQALWDEVVAGDVPSPALLVDHQLACVHLVDAVAAAAAALLPATGMTTLDLDDPLGRACADAAAIARNAVVAEARFLDAGAALLT